MANFKEGYEILMGLEFSNESNALHVNKGEEGLTYKGIYQKAHPLWGGWRIIKSILEVTDDIKEASKKAYHTVNLETLVQVFYRNRFWNRMKLDQIESQKIANEMFIFGVNAGHKTAIKAAQKIVGATVDGLIGPKTIEALNQYDEDKFDLEFDEKEIVFYNEIVERKPYMKRYLRGWENRAVAV